MFLCTRMRSELMQIWPECRKAPSAHCVAAVCKLASSRTMALALPPSSSRTGLRFLPAVDAIMRPTAVEPVKLIFLIAGSSIRAVVTCAASSGRWKRTLSAPAGRPASLKALPIAHHVRGQNSLPFRMQVLPAARGYRIDRIPSTYGAFLVLT